MADKKQQSTAYEKADQIRTKASQIFSPVRGKKVHLTPEERVRQEYLKILTDEYGYSIEQIGEEESVTGRGSAQARADFLIWRSVQERKDNRPAIIVVECKADNVTISTRDYFQGDNYARREGAQFFVTHNNRETRYWRVRTDRRPGYLEEIENIPHADATDEEVKKLINRLKIFKENEFADLLHQCHNVIRNREHLDPAAAFDEIAKVLFVKTHVERDMKEKRRHQNRFTLDYLRTLPGQNPLNLLFSDTKDAYQSDAIFTDAEKINLRPATGEEIVKLLERYNLSDTSEDVKGIAFERFLGRTFRGDIGQFFTPRTIVEFMVHMVAPLEGDVVCDPASGSGGFLIRFFEIVREQMLADVDRQYQAFAAEVTGRKLSEKRRAELLQEKFDDLQTTIDQRNQDSRLWKLANRCIYGCDANDRMARTSKMNMIMHGDGHGGVHHHNGFINVNGIFEDRFDIILTNPPFGANVEATDKISSGDVRTTDEQYQRYAQWYGQAYKDAQERVRRAADGNASIASLFDLPYGGDKAENRAKKLGKIKTEILFLERCLALLKPGGRLGIVLPEGIFNNPSLAYVRGFCEDRAFVRAVVSLPQETFYSAGASVKASLLFMQKFTEAEAADFQAKRQAAIAEIDARYQPEIAAKIAEFQHCIDAAAENIKSAKPPILAERKKMTDQEIQAAVKAANAAAEQIPAWKNLIVEARREWRAYEKQMADIKTREARQLLKERFDYPVFLYDAHHVGITATGEQDVCELYYSDALGLPADFTPEDTALAQYQGFREQPEKFILTDRAQD
jgi:type I restriction enzyme M protein